MKSKFGFVFGAVLMIVALFLILSALGIIPEYVSKIIISWQFFIMLAGIKLLLLRLYFPGAIISVVALYFNIPHIYSALGTEMPITKENLLILMTACLLIVFSLMTIVISSKWIPRTKSFFEVSKDKKGTPEISCAFGEINHTLIEKPFKDMTVSTAFGELNLNMVNTELPEGDSFLKVNNAFGETTITVPDNWVIETSIRSIFGESEDNRNDISTLGTRRLFIQGANAFGTVTLNSVKSQNNSNEDIAIAESEKIESITVKQNNQVHIITLDELFYIQADGDYVTICTAKGNFLKEQTMKYFQSSLPEDRFVRIHRSYIVNIAEINSIDSRGKDTYYIILKNGVSLRASSSGYQELKQHLDI